MSNFHIMLFFFFSPRKIRFEHKHFCHFPVLTFIVRLFFWQYLFNFLHNGIVEEYELQSAWQALVSPSRALTRQSLAGCSKVNRLFNPLSRHGYEVWPTLPCLSSPDRPFVFHLYRGKKEGRKTQEGVKIVPGAQVWLMCHGAAERELNRIRESFVAANHCGCA